jgi:hypothetical protein
VNAPASNKERKLYFRIVIVLLGVFISAQIDFSRGQKSGEKCGLGVCPRIRICRVASAAWADARRRDAGDVAALSRSAGKRIVSSLLLWGPVHPNEAMTGCHQLGTIGL